MTAYAVLAHDLIDPESESKVKDFRFGPAEWCVCTGANALGEAKHRAAKFRKFYRTVIIREVGALVDA